MSTLLTALMLICVGIGALGVLIYSQFEGAGPLGVAKGFAVPKGAGRLDIAARLEKDGIISNRWTFTAGQMLNSALGQHKNGEIKAGSYEFKKNVSMREVVDILVEGRTAAAKITIPEGLTSQQIVERLKAADSLSGEISQMPAEGTLLPDTYVFTRGTSRQDLIERMQAEHTKLVTAAWERRAANVPFQTMKQAVIMASIVEKETGKSDERDRVAAVFVNRLRKNMRLQSDPTIIYGISGGQGPLGRPIMRSDIDQKTAYNTYQIDGLPPTPISNPGRLAIEATLNPAQTNDIYFVADGTGGHAFSETLKEHNAAVSNWRKVEREAKATKEAQAAAAAVPVQPTKINGAKPAPVAAKPADALPVAPGADPTAAGGDAAPDAAAAAVVPLPVRKPKK
ncbi:MAG: endolytic transglycosylase MltG [Hyphomicrobiaceae bacterium]